MLREQREILRPQVDVGAEDLREDLRDVDSEPLQPEVEVRALPEGQGLLETLSLLGRVLRDAPQLQVPPAKSFLVSLWSGAEFLRGERERGLF